MLSYLLSIISLDTFKFYSIKNESLFQKEMQKANFTNDSNNSNNISNSGYIISSINTTSNNSTPINNLSSNSLMSNVYSFENRNLDYLLLKSFEKLELNEKNITWEFEREEMFKNDKENIDKQWLDLTNGIYISK